MKKYVWLNINTGKFSASWTATDEYNCRKSHEDLKHAEHNGYKLIAYECENDHDFEFNNLMRIA